MSEDRLQLAEELLREAVYRSRERQTAFQARSSASCGLGEKGEAVVDLSPRGRELFDRLFTAALDERAAERFRSTVAEWIEQQDSLDRKRNHFLKAFRGRHGFDRGSYARDVEESFEAGLARIAAEEDSARRLSAEELLSPRP